MSQLEKLIAQNRLDLDLMIANDKVSRAARPRRNTDFTNRLSQPDAELIRQYNLQFKKAQAMPKLDEEGNPVLKDGQVVMIYRKYQMPPYPNLPSIDDKLGRELSDAEIRRLNSQHNDLTKRLKDVQKELSGVIRNKYFFVSTSASPNKKRIDDYDEAIEDYKNESNKIEGDLQNIVSRISHNDSVIAANDSIKDQYERDKALAIDMYEKEIKALNQNGFNTERNPGETDEDYYKRMQDNAEVSAQEEDLEDAKIFARNTFRNHLMELFNDNTKIETIYHRIKDDLDKLDIIKEWPFIYKNFTKRYGAYRFAVGPEEFFRFIDELRNPDTVVDDKKQEAVPIPVEEAGDKSFEEEPPGFSGFPPPSRSTRSGVSTEPYYSPSSSAVTPIRTSASYVGGASSLQAAEAEGLSPGAIEQQDLARFIKNNPSIEAARDKNIKEAKALKELLPESKTFGNLQKGLHKASTFETVFSHHKRLQEIRDNLPPVRDNPFTPTAKSSKSDKSKSAGKGISQEDFDEWVRFGKLIINYDKLYHKNNFSIRYPTKKLQAIVGLPNTKVSDHFVKIFTQLLDGSNPTAREINGLHDKERHIYDRVLYIAGLNKKVGDNKHDKTVADMKKRMQLIEGEMEAGNNSPLLAKDLYQTLHTLKDLNVISQKEINRYLSQFKK